MANLGVVIMDCLIGIALALVAGFALPRRFRDWPAAIVLATIGGLATGIATIVYLVPVISGFLTPPYEPVTTRVTDLWSRTYQDGSDEPSHFGPVLLSIAIGLIVAIAVWFVLTCTTRLGMQLRTWLGQLIGWVRPSQRPARSGGRNSANSTG